MDRSRHSQRGPKEPPLRPHAPKSSEERQSLLSFYQRYSYRDGPRDGIVNGNLPPPPSATGRLQRTKSYLTADISTRWADLVLMVCFFVSGLVDSGAYNAYSCFVSMQVSRDSLQNAPMRSKKKKEMPILTDPNHQTDRKHNLPRPRRKLPPRLHPVPSLDQIPHRNPLLPARRSPHLLLPPHLRRAQALGASDFFLLPNARDSHRRCARALWLVERIASKARRAFCSCDCFVSHDDDDDDWNPTRYRLPVNGPRGDRFAEFPSRGQSCGEPGAGFQRVAFGRADDVVQRSGF